MTMGLDPNAAALDGIRTPALILDAAVLATNIERMSQAASAAGVALRPHAKTHKSPDIARAQQRAGAVGTACATVAELEALAAAGIGGLLLTSPFADDAACAAVLAVHARNPVAVAIDDARHVQMLAAASGDRGPVPLDVLVDVDIGQGRTGIVDAAEAVALARLISVTPNLRLAGLQGYAGHVQHVVAAEERRLAAEQAGDRLRRTAAAIAEATGLPLPILSGSGTGAYQFDSRKGPYTELQVGSYVFMDADYGRVRQPDGAAWPFGTSLFVLASIVSARRPGEITVNAGTKALASNGPPPDVLLGVPAGAAYRFGGDEHGIIALPPGADVPEVGRRVLLAATHCDPTVNLHPGYHVMEQGEVGQYWPIVGRHGGRS
ncbi:MAG: alanine racemase [Sneathiellaceae bacterium]